MSSCCFSCNSFKSNPSSSPIYNFNLNFSFRNLDQIVSQKIIKNPYLRDLFKFEQSMQLLFYYGPDDYSDDTG